MDMKHTQKSSLSERQVPPLAAPAASTSGEASSVPLAKGRVDALLHELPVHQLELDANNEALREMQAELKSPRELDVDLYDTATVGGSATGAARALRMAHDGARILLVEDSPINCEVALDLLRAAGLYPDLAINGLQAVKMARSKRYDLILMDVHMPVMDGLQATGAIRLLPGCAGLPIVAMSADAFAQGILACEDAGMNDFIAKPVDSQALYTKLLKWLPLKETSRVKP